MILKNPQNQIPTISEDSWISKTAIILGNVTIGANVYVAHNAVIRADEPGSSIVIGDNCNVQDNVIIHGLTNSEVTIENNTSLAHGCIVHGPCSLGKGCFIGFGSVIFDCTVGENSVILHNATVRSVKIPPYRIVPDGQVVTKQEDANKLENLTDDLKKFKDSVVNTNVELVEGYNNLE